MNFNQTSTRVYDAGMLVGEVDQGEPYKLVACESRYAGADPNGVIGTYQLPADALVNLHEIRFTELDDWVVELTPVSGNVDLGISLYGPTEDIYAKSDVFDDGVTGAAIAWLAAAGEPESIDFRISASEYYCLAVWKVGSSDADLACEYTLSVFPEELLDVDEGSALPTVTRLIGASPNPFNPRTKILFELPQQTLVRLHVYDLAGRLVRTLLNGEMIAAGRHEKVWNGRDDSGRGVATGVYFYRLEAGAYSATKRMTLLK
jgi:hypothetical protein